ncbi:MAG: hypothetical protein DHS20C15_02630 [Planctomycetota bacterium]|nr:MAG: hypothetical protein DHS20C15_02630 [Planctomycetota bacterium]
MAYRPQWYDNSSKGSRAGNWFSDKPAWLLILITTFAIYLVQRYMASSGSDALSQVLGIRAWWPGEGAVPPSLVEDAAGRRMIVPGTPGDASFNWFFPVQAFTYLLVHSARDFWHVFGNMLFLFFLGRELEQALGRSGFLRLYITGGVVGGLACWLSALLQGSVVPTIGASGAVYAVMVLYAFRWPRRTIFIYFMPVPIWLLVAFKVFNDLSGFLSGAGEASGTAVLAHLGGATIGFLWFKRGDLVAQADMTRRRVVSERQAKQSADGRREMDRILGKIQAEGLGALSTKEREFLNRRSKELRERGS